MVDADPLSTPMRATFAGSTATINPARESADRWLRDLGAGEELRSRVALVVSELTSNAVQAAPGRSYELSLETGGDSLTVEVINELADGAPPPRGAWGPDAAMSPRGRGLAIVDSLSDEVVVDRSRPGTVRVTARIHLART